MKRGIAQALRAFVLCLAAGLHGAAWGADWFVAAGAGTGDGSRQQPFADPWRALAAASSGDTIHIAQGTYHGRFDRSAWVVDRPKLTILGGYDRSFSTRDPWKHPAVLAFYRDYEGTSEHNLLYGMGDHRGLVIDGLVIDGAGRNTYQNAAPFGMQGGLRMVGPLASFDSAEVTIRNCVFLNSATGGVELRGEGSTFENNLVLNHNSAPMLSLREKSGGTRQPIAVKGNTFAFAHDETDPPMGKGGEKGVAIRVAAPAAIDGNLFVACGNAAINVFAKPPDLAIDRNVFSLMMRADVAARLDGREVLITDRNLEEMEDLGFKSSTGNKAADAGLTGLNKEWVDGVSRQILLSYATPPKEGLAGWRRKYGLGDATPAQGGDQGPLAPRLEVADAIAVRTSGETGARPIELKPSVAATATRVPAPAYTRTSWADLNAGAPGLEGRPVEVLAAVGNERNGFVNSGITAEKYLGFDVYYPGGDGLPGQIHVYAARNGPAHRQWEETIKSTDPRSEDFYLLRGIARLTSVSRQKATLEVQSIVPGEMPRQPKPPRPAGKALYVRAGASGGDGTKDKPFRDPFQALEKASEGDTIHVAGGEYFGRLRTANWKITVKYLSLLGGYDAQFARRDPWNNPARLVMFPEAQKNDKSAHGGTFLQTSEIATGLILDGFLFDGSTISNYHEAPAGSIGGLQLSSAPIGSMVQLIGPDLTIRNCVFANASGVAVEIGSAAGTFENNVIVNTNGVGVKIAAMGAGPWVLRRNTFLFSMDPTERAGTGKSSMGTHLMFSGRAALRLEANLFAFADNYAVRSTVPRSKVSLEANVFAGNPYCDFSDAQRVWLYKDVWERRLADAEFVSARDNSLAIPAGLPVEKAYLNNAMQRLYGLKGRYTPEQWGEVAGALGAAVMPPKQDGAAATQSVEEKKEEKKEASIEDLMRELDALKQESAKREQATGGGAAAPKGPAYAPAYSWKEAVALPREGRVGARPTLEE